MKVKYILMTIFMILLGKEFYDYGQQEILFCDLKKIINNVNWERSMIEANNIVVSDINENSWLTILVSDFSFSVEKERLVKDLGLKRKSENYYSCGNISIGIENVPVFSINEFEKHYFDSILLKKIDNKFSLILPVNTKTVYKYSLNNLQDLI